jgi:hypothetical protein
LASISQRVSRAFCSRSAGEVLLVFGPEAIYCAFAESEHH